ncbi:GTP-binding protein 5 [Chelonia mydas]|uniref:GTP-binding protein 5 n=1 Tax=Chelonia mydas TaxID=8469 RepID=M7C5Q4_CHEMY|nr:GTP-binding protein 5 [Chelonia mydas]
MLDENHHLIQCIMDYQSKGKTAECTQYQQILHRNLVYLATIADSNQNMQSLLPAATEQPLDDSNFCKLVHKCTCNSENEALVLVKVFEWQQDRTEVLCLLSITGPNHVSMQQSGQNTMPTTSLSMTVSSHGTGPGYSHTVPASQNVPMQGQGSIGNYVSRTNISMQSNPVSMMHQQAATSHYNSAQGGSQHYQGQSSIAMMSQSNQGNSMMGQRPMGPYRPSQQGSSQQYMGQEEYYSEQYSHGQGSSEPMNQQYYPDGHGDYAYQQSSYTEQSYDRSFEDSTQHYYEGVSEFYTVLKEIPSIASRRQDTNRELRNSKHIHSNSTQISKAIQDNNLDMTRYFVDHRRVCVIGGHGGSGINSFHSEPRKEFGGPDGGNGGDGGHVILKADQQIKSLASVLPLYRGFHGERGRSKNCYGANGGYTYIKVPVGTVVKEDCKIVADLAQHGEEYVAAYGGTGGKGNRFFLSNENRAPMTATLGESGFPNAGKSSLLRAISNAKPAVAPYPFTTLNPHVGIVHYQDYEQVAVADVPGIIRGAHLNRGLGLAFLRHIEHCRFLLFVVDLSVSEPWIQLQDLKYELEQYEEGLSKRPHAVIGNKIDLPQSKANLLLLKERVEQSVIPLSALTGDNLEELLLHLRDLYDAYVNTEQSRKQNPVKW